MSDNLRLRAALERARRDRRQRTLDECIKDAEREGGGDARQPVVSSNRPGVTRALTAREVVKLRLAQRGKGS